MKFTCSWSMLQEQSLTPDLMAFVACCIPASSFHPHKAKLARTSCLLCRPSTLTPHATWQKKRISTQILKTGKASAIGNWPKCNLYCPFGLKTRRPVTALSFATAQVTSKSSSSLAAKQWWSLRRFITAICWWKTPRMFLSEKRPPKKIATV